MIPNQAHLTRGKRRTGVSLTAGVSVVVLALAGCGVKGPPQSPPPLWGAPDQAPVAVPDIGVPTVDETRTVFDPLEDDEAGDETGDETDSPS